MLVLAILLFVGFVIQDRLIQPIPTINSLTTAYNLENGEIVGETRVFDIGDEVFFVFTLERGRSGHVVAVQINRDGAQVNAGNLTYHLPDQDLVREAVTFTPELTGTYTATLFLDGAPVEDAQVTFKVVEGGPRLQEVQTAKGVNPETFEPEQPSTRFTAQETVYITYRVVDAVPGDRLTIQYSIDGVLQPPDPFDHTTLEEAGNFRGHFSLQGREDNQLPAGHYRAELFYNDDLVAVVHFEVVAGG